jgi:hypothetical protein
VAQALGLDAIPCIARTAINQEAFVAALRIGLPEAMKEFPDRYPILHLSAHGGGEGIQLSNGDVFRWDALRQLLIPINQSLKGALLLCMSACEGYSACRMAMEQGDTPHPYLAMVGNYGKPTWSDTAVSYLAFYHLLAKGRTILEAIDAMKSASGDPKWVGETADEIKRSYIEFVEKSGTPAQAQRALEAVAAEEDLPPASKALEETRAG